MSKRRMVGWQPLTVENTAVPAQLSADTQTQARARSTVSDQVPAESIPAPSVPVAAPQAAQPEELTANAAASGLSGPVQDPAVPRRRMAGWTPLSVAGDTAQVGPVAPSAPVTAEPESTVTVPSVPSAEADVAQDAVQASSGLVQDPDLPRRRMVGWQPLVVGHPDRVAPTVTKESAPVAEASAPVAGSVEPAKKRMGAPGVESAPASAPGVKMPDVVTPPPAAKPAATRTVEKDVVKKPSTLRKVLLTLLGVAVVAAGLVLVAQWVRTLDPVAEFIATYDGTPTHPGGVVAGIPGWVGWQHFLNFFIMAMGIRSGLLIRNQQRPEAYWTPDDGGFYSPGKRNTPQKVSIQQWIHQSLNVLWVANGLFFYVMVFATGHWMRLVPTNWDIFPNIVSAGLQYVSLDWPEENSWVYYNALQVMTYFLTVFIAAPLAVLTGLRLSTWWPQNAGINKAFTLPVARKIHFGTMVYFILFILVHLFLVFTTGVLSNLNMMFTSRDAGDWWGIGVFAVSVAVTVGIAWLLKPILISPI